MLVLEINRKSALKFVVLLVIIFLSFISLFSIRLVPLIQVSLLLGGYVLWRSFGAKNSQIFKILGLLVWVIIAFISLSAYTGLPSLYPTFFRVGDSGIFFNGLVLASIGLLEIGISAWKGLKVNNLPLYVISLLISMVGLFMGMLTYSANPSFKVYEPWSGMPAGQVCFYRNYGGTGGGSYPTYDYAWLGIAEYVRIRPEAGSCYEV